MGAGVSWELNERSRPATVGETKKQEGSSARPASFEGTHIIRGGDARRTPPRVRVTLAAAKQLAAFRTPGRACPRVGSPAIGPGSRRFLSGPRQFRPWHPPGPGYTRPRNNQRLDLFSPAVSLFRVPELPRRPSPSPPSLRRARNAIRRALISRRSAAESH